MKNIKTWLMAVLILSGSYAGSVAVASTPLEFKGIALGSPEKEVKLKLPKARCTASTDDTILGDRECSLTTSIADVPAFAIFRFYTDSLSSIYILYDDPQINFSIVISALTEKYGPPTKLDKEVRTTGIGVKFINQMVVWELGSGSIEAEKYAGNITSSSVRFIASGYTDEYLKRSKEREKVRAKDL